MKPLPAIMRVRTEDNYGRITILLRDVTDVQDPDHRRYHFAYDARNEGTEKAEQTTFNRHQVWVGVKAEKGADSYMYTTEYRRKDSFQPIYTWKGKTASADRSRSTG